MYLSFYLMSCVQYYAGSSHAPIFLFNVMCSILCGVITCTYRSTGCHVFNTMQGNPMYLSFYRMSCVQYYVWSSHVPIFLQDVMCSILCVVITCTYLSTGCHVFNTMWGHPMYLSFYLMSYVQYYVCYHVCRIFYMISCVQYYAWLSHVPIFLCNVTCSILCGVIMCV